MKLRGYTNGKKIVSSIAHYDFRTYGEGDDYIMADGGQPGIGDFAGYSRHWGGRIWFEVPQDHATLYEDWRHNRNNRLYGIWDFDDVELLAEDDIPDTNSLEWRAENAIWGTRGVNGDQPTTFVMLGECSKEHLENIKILCLERNRSDLVEVVDFWLSKGV